MIAAIYISAAVMCFVAVFLFFLYHDYKQWENNIPINHNKERWQRVVAQLPAAIFFTKATGQIGLMALLAIVAAYLMMNFIWWEFFDGIFNLKRGKHWRYNGSFNDVGHDDPPTDKFLKRLHPVVQGILKWSLIAGSTYLYIISFNTN